MESYYDHMSVEERTRTCVDAFVSKPKVRSFFLTPSLTSTLRMFRLTRAGCVDPDTAITPGHHEVFVEQDALFIPSFQSQFWSFRGLLNGDRGKIVVTPDNSVLYPDFEKSKVMKSLSWLWSAGIEQKVSPRFRRLHVPKHWRWLPPTTS